MKWGTVYTLVSLEFDDDTFSMQSCCHVTDLIVCVYWGIFPPLKLMWKVFE